MYLCGSAIEGKSSTPYTIGICTETIHYAKQCDAMAGLRVDYWMVPA
jgi:hypothetical protein